MTRFKLVTTAKVEGVTEEAVGKAALKSFPGYRVAKIEDLGDKWQVRLDAATKEAAPPPFLKEKDDAGNDADSSDDSDSDSDSDSDADSDSDSDSSDDSDADSKGDDSDDSKGDSKKKDPVAQIESVINELKGLLDQLGGHASDLKEKADKVDEIHQLTKGDGDVDSMDAVPPVPPMDDAAVVGPTPGGSAVPKPPRKPPVPTGRAPGGPGPGVPGVFGSHQTEIVEHPIKDDDGEYSFADVEAAVKAHPNLTEYQIEEIKPVHDKNVYVAKLTRK